MILTDAFVVDTWHPGNVVRYAVEGALVVAVIAIGRVITAARRRRTKTAP
jgi:hypothetical protein